MSITKARKPLPGALLEGFPPDTRIVIADVTWEDYDRFSRAVRGGENCRVAFDGKDIELIAVGSALVDGQQPDLVRSDTR